LRFITGDILTPYPLLSERIRIITRDKVLPAGIQVKRDTAGIKEAKKND
jgi:hypothetical protein